MIDTWERVLLDHVWAISYSWEKVLKIRATPTIGIIYQISWLNLCYEYEIWPGICLGRDFQGQKENASYIP